MQHHPDPVGNERIHGSVEHLPWCENRRFPVTKKHIKWRLRYLKLKDSTSNWHGRFRGKTKVSEPLHSQIAQVARVRSNTVMLPEQWCVHPVVYAYQTHVGVEEELLYNFWNAERHNLSELPDEAEAIDADLDCGSPSLWSRREGLGPENPKSHNEWVPQERIAVPYHGHPTSHLVDIRC